MLRYSRIAFSVGWVLVGLLVIALWVRSYHYDFRVSRWGKDAVFVSLVRGRVYIIYGRPGFPRAYLGPQKGSRANLGPPTWTYSFGRAPLGLLVAVEDEMAAYSARALAYKGWALNIRLWLPLLLAGLLAALPAFRFRYSLRTLLGVMTLVAAGLGAIVWAVR